MMHDDTPQQPSEGQEDAPGAKVPQRGGDAPVRTAGGQDGPGRPKGLPKTGGRQRGTPNKITSEIRETILARGKPVEFLCDVARGKKIRVGPQAGPTAEYVYPDIGERMEAATVLLRKIAPDMKAQEITGADGGPVAVTLLDFLKGLPE